MQPGLKGVCAGNGNTLLVEQELQSVEQFPLIEIAGPFMFKFHELFATGKFIWKKSPSHISSSLRYN
jgi:hypothetical protein